MFGWLRRARPARDIPDAHWQRVLRDHPFIAARPQAELQRLREMTGRFLADKEFTGANGIEVTDAMAIAIAAQAVLPVLYLGMQWYEDFVGIVVHPGQVVAPRKSQDEAGVVHEWREVIAGETQAGGPVTLSWQDVEGAGLSAAQGYNVVVHEFIHKIDMRDGHANGCPPLPTASLRHAWPQVMQAEWEAFREKTIIAQRFGGEPPWLDPYGATAPAEFFAVAGEAYFTNRARFAAEHPRLLSLFDEFFLHGAPH